MIFKSKIILESVTCLKIVLSLYNFKRLPIHPFSLSLVILEMFPKYGNTILHSNFGAVVKHFVKCFLKYFNFKVEFGKIRHNCETSMCALNQICVEVVQNY